MITENRLLKAKYEEVVVPGYFGHPVEVFKKAARNGKNTEEVFFNAHNVIALAEKEDIPFAESDAIKRVVIGIDYQNTFMPGGELPVAGADEDIERFCGFIWRNFHKIYQIALTMDDHRVFQIFHPSWFVDKNGNNPAPFTMITSKDIETGKWSPVEAPVETLDCLKFLEAQGKKVLVTWTYHGLEGTIGQAIENNLANLMYFHSKARHTEPYITRKGQDPISEMYGGIKKEYNPNNEINTEFLNLLTEFDEIYIGGEAMSHCVEETVRQILEYFEGRPEITSRIRILEDCMSPIQGFEKAAKDNFAEFQRKYGIKMIKSDYLIK